MTEQWKDVLGYEGVYQVSDKGRVKCLNYRHTGIEKLMTPQNNGHGYYWVAFRFNGKHKKDYKYVHRLVAEAFLENPQNYSDINHKDEDRSNNCADNLEWCTTKYNLAYGSRHEREIETQRKTHPNRIAVLQFSKDGSLIGKYGSQREAQRETGVHSSSVSACCNGKLKTAGGYVWKYNNYGQQRGEIKTMNV